MDSTKNKAANVDEYIVGFPKEIQERLKAVRAAIKKAAPKAEEVISYQMPAYKYYGSLVFLQLLKIILAFMPHQPDMLHLKKHFPFIKKVRARFNFRTTSHYHWL